MTEETQPPKKFSSCPSCHFNHPAPADQCEQCGLIFAKWVDPKKKAAEARLSQISAESQKGIPLGLKIFLLILIGGPILLYTVPEVETFILGAKLRYTLNEKSEFKHSGVLESKISSLTPFGEAVNTLTSEKLLCETQINVLSRDSGGNTQFLRKFLHVRWDSSGPIPSSQELSDEVKDTWGMSISMNPYGGQIESLSASAQGAARSAKIQNQHQQMRAEQMEKRYSDPGMGAQNTMVPLSVVEPEPYFDLSKNGFLILYETTPWNFPKERIRKGDTWEQHVKWEIYSPKFRINLNKKKLLFTLSGFERTAQGFQARVSWDWDLEPTISVSDSGIGHYLQGDVVEGKFKGKALIHYKTGLITDLEGTFHVTLAPQNRTISGGLVQISGTHTIQQN